MKRNYITAILRDTLKYAAMLFGILAMLSLNSIQLFAQDTTAVEEEAEEDVTIKSRMSLTGTQLPDGTIELNGLLRARVDGSYEKVPDQKVTFFILNDDAEETVLGEGTTGSDGMARFSFNRSGRPVNTDGFYSFLARYDGDDRMNGSESDLLLRPARLVMEAVEADSTFTLRIQAVAPADEGNQPIIEAPVSIYVKRMFSSLKVAEGETDAEGILEIEFPTDMAGDQDGNLDITARIEESEEYGNLEARVMKPWGKPISYSVEKLPDTLFSPNPPHWMIITFFILMGTVWSHYLIIIFNLFRVRNDPNAHSQ